MILSATFDEPSPGLLIVGRFIAGAGVNTMLSIIDVYYCVWCKRFLSFAMASIIDLTKAGIAMDSFVSPILIGKYDDIRIPFWMVFGVLCFSFVCVLLMLIIDKMYDEKYIPASASDSQSKTAKLKEVCNIRPILWMLALCAGLIKGVGFAFNTNSAILL